MFFQQKGPETDPDPQHRLNVDLCCIHPLEILLTFIKRCFDFRDNPWGKEYIRKTGSMTMK
jgi:hypothetical protein